MELPVYERGEVAQHCTTIHARSASGASYFVRRIAVTPAISVLPLPEAVAYADREFAAIAAHCGALVVEHSWGVSEHSPAADNDLSLFGRPDLDLVARVAAIPRQPMRPRTSIFIKQQLRSYYQQCTQPFEWSDRAPSAFILGQGIPSEATPYLVDIDLRFLKNKRYQQGSVATT